MIAKRQYGFAMAVVVIVILWSSACRESDPAVPAPSPSVTPEPAPLVIDLEEIQARGTLRVLIANSSTSFFLYKGKSMGYEYELMDEICKDLGLELELHLLTNYDDMFERLEQGQVDVIAGNLTKTRERAKRVAFCAPHLHTRQVLVQQLPAGHEEMRSRKLNTLIAQDFEDLIGEEITVMCNSSFKQRLEHLSEELGEELCVVEAAKDQSAEDLIAAVAHGQIKYTIADENIARINQSYYGNLDVSMGISLPQQIAWATRKNAPELREALNQWLTNHRSTSAYLYRKYFADVKNQNHRVHNELSSEQGGGISIYDDQLKRECLRIDWDWRLIAALIYQESRFDPKARSWMGAFGLMQLMPSSAVRYGIDSSSSAEENISAGIDKIRRLDAFWSKKITHQEERIKFVLASYNAGLGHVLDARRLALKYGKNPFLWDDHVAEFIRLKSQPQYYRDEVVRHGYCRGQEPYNYVREILNRYDRYVQLIER